MADENNPRRQSLRRNVFDVLLLLARPAAGKSEIIHFLKNTPPAERRHRFYVGPMLEIDDFPMLWTWFEEDDLLSQMGFPRLHTTPDGYFRWPYLWNLLVRRINLAYSKHLRDSPAGPAAASTILVEFSRGKEHGGYREAFEHLSPELAARAAILYVNVSFKESLRKNRRRYNPARPDSILEHGLSDEKMHRLYRESDWSELTGGRPSGFLEIQGRAVPFVVFENEDDVTTSGGPPLANRLEDTLHRLWELRAPGS